ncbi:nitroreductase family deazaflavin-dependent oxidoreductase [Kouleothrix sp.]|uniref:nitroreductase family deazaflavin-dependent oxidoreductase n=1 Tax=Kouleothrix sp. TaxID=2779161 RepID=UPI00391D1B93
MPAPPETMPWPERLIRKFLMSRPGIWYGRYILPYLDLPLLYLSRGRYSMSPGQPILLLFTTGARSGRRRATPMVYLADGDRLIVIASNGGRDRHPGWYYNLRAHPLVTAFVAGRAGRYQARLVEGDERAALWRMALEYYEGFALYEQRTARRIPIFVLEPLR